MKLNFLFSFFALLIFGTTTLTVFSQDEVLPIIFKQTPENPVIQIENRGECPFYKLRISTLPPERQDIAGLFSRFTARYMGINSFIKTIEFLKENETIRVKKIELINSEGKVLNDEFKVGMWVIKASYCGDDKIVEFPAE